MNIWKDPGSSIVCVKMPEEEKISGIGFVHQMSVRETFQLHTHSFFEFFYVLKGKATHDINGQTMLLNQGTLVFIRPRDVHQYSFINDYDMELLSIGIDSTLITQACDYLGISVDELKKPELPLQVVFEGRAHWDMVDKLFAIKKKECGEDRRTYFKSILPDLLYRILYTEERQEKTLPVWLSRLVKEMSQPQNYLEGLTRMLQLSEVSQEHLNREFRRYFEMTPTEFINMKRVNHGAALLLEKKNNILDVCYSCGFNNLSYFYKVFEKIYHCTPKQFLNEHSSSI